MLLLLAIREPEYHIYSLLRFIFQFLFDPHLHNTDELHIVRVQLEIFVPYVGASAHGDSCPSEWLHLLFLVIIIPIGILATALVGVIFFAQGQGYRFLHLFVSSSSVYIGLVPFSFHFLLLVLLDSLGRVPLLVIVVVVE